MIPTDKLEELLKQIKELREKTRFGRDRVAYGKSLAYQEIVEMLEKFIKENE